MFQKIFTASLFVLMTTALWAQQELGLHFSDNLLQASKTNPAFMTENALVVGLPDVLLSYYHTGPSFNDMIQQNDNGDNVLNVAAIIDGLESENILRSVVEIESFNIALQLAGFQFGLNHSVKVNGFVNYPKNLPDFFWNGNAQFIGETVEIGPDLQIYAYNEIGLSVAKRINRLHVGAKLKLLTGIGDISTEKRQASIFTSDDVYQLTLNTDYRLNTAAYLKIDDLTNFAVDTELGNYTLNDLFSNNTGFGLDLGLIYELTNNLQVAASVIDIGSINWNSEVRNYTSQGTTQYDGLDISNLVRDENLTFGNLTDTLDQIFKFEETSASYSTQLPRKIYLSAKYKFNDLWTFNALYFNENYRSQSFSGFAIGANTSLGSLFTLGASYAVRYGRFDNLGLNASVKLGPAQIYMVTDNIIGAFSPYDNSNMNIRFGLNLVFWKSRANTVRYE